MTTILSTLAEPDGAPRQRQLDWLERARAVAPAIAEWRDAAEQERHLPSTLFEILRGTGLFALGAPPELGGASIGHEDLLEVVEELSRHDGSVGWNVTVAAHAAVVAGTYLPEASRGEIYTRGANTVFAGGLLPKGTARPVAGGFLVSGRWGFASGCQQADWLLAPGLITADGRPRLRQNGTPEMRAFCVPVSQAHIADTWYTAGLRGTGSHDFQLSDVFVPAEHSFPIQPDGPNQPGLLTLRHLLPYAWPSIAAVALGIARDAIDSFVQLAVNKTPTLGSSTLANQHVIQERVGRAQALVGSARAFLHQSVRQLPMSPDWSVPVSDELTARIRLANAHAAQSAAEAVDLLFSAAGTSSIVASNRLERCLRDVQVVRQHAAVERANIEMVGQYLLGLGLHLRR